jgi:hypothetical protein
VIIIVSLPLFATSVGCVIAASRASSDGAGIPQRVIASTCASRRQVGRVVAPERSGGDAAEELHPLRAALA